MSKVNNNLVVSVLTCSTNSSVLSINRTNGHGLSVDMHKIHTVEFKERRAVHFSDTRERTSDFRCDYLDPIDFIKLREFIQEAFVATRELVKTTL